MDIQSYISNVHGADLKQAFTKSRAVAKSSINALTQITKSLLKGGNTFDLRFSSQSPNE